MPGRPCVVPVCANQLMQALKFGKAFCFACWPCWCHVIDGGSVPHRIWSWPLPCPFHGGRNLPSQFSQLMTQMEWRAHSGQSRGCQHVKSCWLCGGGVAPPMQKVGCVIVVMVLPLSRLSWIVALFVASCGQSKFLREWPSLSNRMVLLWVSPGSFLMT